MDRRIILHSDLNNYYASVECMLNEDLRDKYVAVCGKREDRHGIVLAKNQKAKLMGVQTGETIWQAQQKCPDLIIVPPHFQEYIKYSRLVRDIYYRYTDRIEPYGLDECWLDVTGSTSLFGSGEQIANSIRNDVKKELGLTVSVGVSFNKVFAKLGSDMKKPDAVTVISRENFKEKIWHLPASEILGVGRATKRKLELKSIYTIGDIAKRDVSLMRSYLGVNGEMLWQFANGLEEAPVRLFGCEPQAKSMGHGITCIEDLYNNDEVRCVFLELAQGVSHRLRQADMYACGVQITVKNNALEVTGMQKGILGTQSFYELCASAMQLFEKLYDWKRPVRALSITAINLKSITEACQPDIFTDMVKRDKLERIELAMKKIQNRYGRRAVRPAVLLKGLKMPEQNFEETLIMPGFPGR
ncbi:MAG: DNA polymerase IV [Christensenellaceae bacterium]|nr:DNA polymerase IV [Christensenellaceae bacterium]